MNEISSQNIPNLQSGNNRLSILLYSQIPVINNNGLSTLDLWAKDLNTQVSEGMQVTLFCEVLDAAPPEWQGIAPLDDGIKVIASNINREVVEALADCRPDVFQIPGNMQWQDSGICRAIVNLAKKRKIPVVVGISSNRAKTQILNAANFSLLRKIKAYLQALSIRVSQFYLTSVCDGTFIVGDGLKQLVSPFCKNLHIGIASWITRSQIHERTSSAAIPPLKLAVAARLEPMKGIYLAVEALKILLDKGYKDANLDILGEGPEKANLVNLVNRYQLNEYVNFLGTFAYPSPFLDVLENYGLILVTNLNDEQPRIVFDVLSRGIIPVCPDRLQFRAIGLPDEILFTAGEAEALAERLEKLAQPGIRESIQARLSSIIQEFTLENMHIKRKQWLLDLVSGRR